MFKMTSNLNIDFMSKRALAMVFSGIKSGDYEVYFSRVTADGASFVCSVVSTMCPVSAA